LWAVKTRRKENTFEKKKRKKDMTLNREKREDSLHPSSFVALFKVASAQGVQLFFFF
jgi:predicted RNA-binding protein